MKKPNCILTNPDQFKIDSSLIRLFFLLFSLINSLNLHSQHIPYTHYSEINGLPSSETYCIIEDYNGFIWIGTDRGLTRFDGSEFKVFSKEQGLEDNVIFDIYEDDNHTLWILCYHQLFFSEDHETFYPYAHNSVVWERHQSLNVFFNEVKVTNDSVQLFANDGLKVSISQEGSFRIKQFDIEKNDETLFNEITDVNKIKANLFDTFSDFYQYYLGQSKKYLVQEYQIGDSLKKIEEICYDYHVYKTRSFLKRRYLFIDSVKEHFIAPSGYIEINHFFDKKKNKAYYIPFNSSQKFLLESLQGKYIVGYVIDHQNGLWVTTNKNGLYYFENMELRQVLTDEPITHVFETPRKTLLIHSGWKDKYVDHIKSPEPYHLEVTKTIGSIDSVTTQNQLLRLTSNGDILLKDRFLGFRSIQIKDGTVYTCGGGIVSQYSSESIEDAQVLSSIIGESIMSFFVEHENSIWVGGLNGLYYCNGYSTEKYRFKNGIVDERVEDIKKNKTTRELFIATLGNGLYIVKEDSILIHFNEANSPLANNNINQLYLEGDSILWIGTTKGINVLDLKKKPYNLTPPCILGEPISKKIHQIIPNSYHLNFLTSNGLFQFHKNKYIDISSIKVNLILDEINVNGEKILASKNMKLDHNQNHIDIRFSAPVFGDVLKARTFEYRFIGRGATWQKTKNNRLTFINLTPDDYQLEIRVMCFNREISRKRLCINFDIKPPFWSTSWFIALVSIIVVLLMVITAQFLFKREKRKNRVSQERIELKQKALRAQLNSHFIFNTLSAIQYSISRNPILETKKQVENFSLLLREVLEKSDDTLFPILKEIELIKKYITVENFRFQKNIQIQIEMMNQNIRNYLIPPLLLQPLIENAIQHGFLLKPDQEKNIIKISFAIDQLWLRITLEDNGVGLIKVEAKHGSEFIKKESRGLELVKQRLKSLYQSKKISSEAKFSIEDLSISNPKAQGTIITLHIPIIKQTEIS